MNHGKCYSVLDKFTELQKAELIMDNYKRVYANYRFDGLFESAKLVAERMAEHQVVLDSLRAKAR